MAKIVPFTEARATLSRLLDEVEARHEQVVITRNGRPAAVLVPAEEQEILEETLEVLQDEELLEALRESEDDARNGGLTPLQDLAVLPRVVQEAVLDTLTLLEAHPEELGRELRGPLRDLWSCRIGNYRILYNIERTGETSKVIVRAVRHRGIAHRTGPGRR